jgi:signal transduction histidine kinase
MITIQRLNAIATTAILILALSATGVFAGDPSAEVQSLVQKAVSYYVKQVKDQNKDHVRKIMNSVSGSQAVGLRKGALYVFGVDFSGDNHVMAIHPINKGFVGKDLSNVKGAKGELISKQIVDVAKSTEAAGWTEYWWKRHGEKNPTLKRTYIMKVPGENLALGAGYYADNVAAKPE